VSAGRALAIGLIVGVLPRAAEAGLFDVIGFGARPLAMGNAMVAEADDFAAAFYNPAALTRARTTHFAGGVQLTLPRLDVDRSSPERAGFETEETESFWGWSLALAVPLGGDAGGRRALGFTLFLPSERLLRAATLDAGQPQFHAYENLADKLTLALGGAWEVLPGLSVGAGVQILADIIGDVEVDANLVTRRFSTRSTFVELVPSAAPTAGLLWEPAPGVRLGAACRTPLTLDYDIPARVDLGETVSVDLRLWGVALYTPLQVTLGGAWEVGDSGWTLSVDTTWADWSEAPDPAPRLEIDLGGELLEGVGLGDAIDVGTDARPLDPGLSDTLTPRLGVEYRPEPDLAVRAGYFFRPTPLPVQAGPTNYVDSHAHVVSLGAALTFPNPTREARRPVTLEAAVQWTQHQPRDTHKQDPADPVGDYTMGGSLLTLQAGVRFDY